MKLKIPTSTLIASFNMEGKNVGDQVEDSYEEVNYDWEGEDIWKIDNTVFRTGSLSSTFAGQGQNNRSYWNFNTIRGSSNELSFRMFIRMTDLADAFHVIEFGAGNHTVLGTGSTDQHMIWRIWITRAAGALTLRIDTVIHNQQYQQTIETILNDIDYEDSSWIGLRVDYNWTTFTARFYYDRGESGFGPDGTGEWIYAGFGTFNSSSHSILQYLVIQSTRTVAHNYNEIYIDDIAIFSDEPIASDELSKMISGQCSVAEDFQGSTQLTIADHNMANFSTLKDFVRFHGEIWNDALTRKLGEYTFARNSFSRHEVNFLGIERGRILQKTPAEYNAILGDGEVTSVSDDAITDDNAEFTADLIGKFVTFTDTEGPVYEIDYPNSNSDLTESDRATSLSVGTEYGSYAELDGSGGWLAIEDHNDMCFRLEFTVLNAAISTGFKITVSANFQPSGYMTTDPDLYIYNTFTSEWVKVADFPINISATKMRYSFSVTDLVDKTPSHYFTGTTLKIALHAGVYEGELHTSEAMSCNLAECENTYSTLFSANNIIYTIDDVPSSTTLTFTGQTPNVDGVAKNDRYKVGDTLKNIILAIWNAAFIDWLDLNMDATSKVDATDWQSSMVLPVLSIYKERLGARLWQSIGYKINISDTFDSTGLTLTEEDEVTDFKGKGFEWLPDGTNIIQSARVFGAGVFDKDEQVPEYPSRQGIIITDNRVSTQEAALDLVDKSLIKDIGPRETLKMTIDLDMVGLRSWDSNLTYETVVLFRTINVSLSIGGVEKIAIPTGKIIAMNYFQANDGHLRTTLLIEVP